MFGWEGTASDLRILKNALNREDKLVIPKGRYYLVDAGLPHTTTLMAPYRGVRYHLKEYSARALENAKELFNLRHASLRNAIERAFGVLKRRFPIIRKEDRDKNLEDEVKMMKEEQVTKKEHIKWTDWMDSCFIQYMMTQDDKGLRISGSFIPQAYSNMVEELNQKFGKSLTKSHLKNRLKTLKSGFSQWFDMFRGTSLSGFGWNSETQLIEADEEVWANLINVIKARGNFIEVQKIPNYNEMIALFARDRASGVHAETPKEKNARLNKTGDIKVETIEEVDQLLASNDITLEKQQKNNDDDDDGLDDIQVLSPTCFSPVQNSSSKKYKTKKRKHEIEDEDEPEVEPESFEKVIMRAVKDVASAMREGNKIFENSHHRVYTGDEIYKELEPMDLEPDELAEALMVLHPVPELQLTREIE
uniref:Myb/SANT-like domain-containing protein n=1 Tax=Lactuca sativa TaxID=4236 RepID=A0A9R1XFZ0_LACSA|nr:hypothetical protein LSAT_V11C400162550 [Lactuca sativa]